MLGQDLPDQEDLKNQGLLNNYVNPVDLFLCVSASPRQKFDSQKFDF